MQVNIHSPKFGSFTALVDDEDSDKIKQYKWVVDIRKNDKIYARASIKIGVNKFSYIYLHRLIMNFPKNRNVDHKNNDGLDNRKENLRTTPKAGGQNGHNRGKCENNSTGFKGVYFYTSGQFKGRYSAKIGAYGEKIWGGYFDTALEAANKVNELCKKHHKEFACLNEFSEEQKIQLAALLLKKK